MTSVLDERQVGGVVHDLEHAQTLSDDDCQMLAVSSRTLYVLQNLSGRDTGFLTRWAASFVGNGIYFPVERGSSQSDEVSAIVDDIKKELSPVTCDLVAVLEGIKVALSVNSCGCDVGLGLDNENGEPGGDVPADIGPIVYEEPSIGADRLCKGANLIHGTLVEVFTKLDNYNVDDMSILGLAFVVGLVGAVVASAVATPMAGLIVAVAGMVAVFAARLMGITVSLADIVTALNSAEEDLICALFLSTDADGAVSDYEAVLVAEGLSAAEASLVALLLPHAVCNILWFDTGELDAAFWASYSGAVDCATCLPQPCPFDLEEGSGVPTYEGSSFIIASAPDAGNHTITMDNDQECPTGNGNWCVEFISTTITIPESTFQRALVCWKSSTTSGVTFFSGQFPDFDTPYTIGRMQFISASPFTITMKINGPLEYCIGTPEDGCG